MKEGKMIENAGEAALPVHEGGCLCGAVRYRVVGSPLSVAICHCTNCQRNTGSAFSVNVIFPKEALTMEGSPAIYEDKGDTGNVVRRVFCGKCGTPLESQSVFSAPEYAVLKSGSFDDPTMFVPDSEVYCVTAMPWWLQGGKRPRYERFNTDAISAEANAAAKAAASR
jgi:hypothetical protein